MISSLGSRSALMAMFLTVVVTGVGCGGTSAKPDGGDAKSDSKADRGDATSDGKGGSTGGGGAAGGEAAAGAAGSDAAAGAAGGDASPDDAADADVAIEAGTDAPGTEGGTDADAAADTGGTDAADAAQDLAPDAFPEAPSSDVPTVQMAVGPTGGTITSADGRVSLEIPAGALAASTTFSIGPASSAPAGAVGTVWEIGPTGTTFAKPVVLTLRYDMNAGSPPAGTNVAVATVVGDHWQRMPSVLDGAGGAHAAIVHLSLWAVVRKVATDCLNDVTCGKTCCDQLAGKFSGDAEVMTCRGAAFFDYIACYAGCAGTTKPQNYGSTCLRDCCHEHRGTVDDAADCRLAKPGDLAAVYECARDCLGDDPEPFVCFVPPRGRCAPCADNPNDSCHTSGAACVITHPGENGAPDTTTPGKCQGFGNKCGLCVEACEKIETCDNQRDDDCNGVIDDGCRARRCTSSATCAQGQDCVHGFCTPCGDPANVACTTTGAACSFKEEANGPTIAGKCQGYGNKCGTCEAACAAIETCANGRDDDCNGQIDDGCEARRCTVGSACPEGQDCLSGFCGPCNDPALYACTNSGAACSYKENGDAQGATINGKCQGYGNKCGTCEVACAAIETCGNGVDDDCNGTIDDGCAARQCASSKTCPAGRHCVAGYCTPCEVDPLNACTVSGAACSVKETDPPATIPGKCEGFGSGCGTCLVNCASSDTCGNDIDDDCNGVIDDDDCQPPLPPDCAGWILCEEGQQCG
jgi:hypothetical protein